MQINADCVPSGVPLFMNMKVMLTMNRDKRKGFVNGQLGNVARVQNNTIFVKLRNEKLVAVYPVTMQKEHGTTTFYPLVPAYALTICKCQGQTLPKVLLWFDGDKVPKGTGYVAVTRVKTLNDLRFLSPLKPCHFRPVTGSLETDDL